MCINKLERGEMIKQNRTKANKVMGGIKFYRKKGKTKAGIIIRIRMSKLQKVHSI